MTFQIIFEENAINRAAGFLADDPDDPRPRQSFAFGSPDLRRLRVGRYRVLYRIEAEAISVGHIARSTATA